MGLKAALKATAKNLKTSSSHLESPIEEYVGYEVMEQGLRWAPVKRRNEIALRKMQFITMKYIAN